MKSFTAGAAAAVAAIKTLNRIAWSDTQVGRDARKHVLARMDHDKLLQLELDVTREIARRRDTGAPPKGEAT